MAKTSISDLSLRIAALALISAGVAAADIVATFDPATVQAPNPVTLCAGATTCIIGVQDFNAWGGGDFTTDYGTSNKITGSYSGGAQNSGAGQYGGAGGTGTYPVDFAGTPDTLQLSTAGVPGVNYFGLWFSALDDSNLLQFYSGDTLVYSFTPTIFAGLVGACTGSNAFCGNPNANFLGQNSGQQYAYLNFFDKDGFFDKVTFTQIGGGGFESDNHAVGYMDPVIPSGTTIPSPAPEPSFFAFTGLGFFGLAVLAARRRKA